MESRIRTLAKAASWRLAASAMTAGIAWLLTGQLQVAAAMGLLDTAIKVGAFYLHERLWLRINFGQTRR